MHILLASSALIEDCVFEFVDFCDRERDPRAPGRDATSVIRCGFTFISQLSGIISVFCVCETI